MTTMPSMRELLAQRAEINAKQETLDKAHPTDSLPEAEQRQWDALKVDLKGVNAAIERRAERDETERQMRGKPLAGTDNRWDELIGGYSLSRAIFYADSSVDSGREREASAEMERRFGRKPRGIWVPHEVFRTRHTETRAGQVVGTANLGGVLDPDRFRADLYTDQLRAASVLPRLGVQFLDGLMGTTVIPKMLTSGTTQWLDENEEVDESTATFGGLSLAPHTVAANMSYSRRTMISATPSIDGLLRDDMGRQIAGAIDAAAIGGDGVKEPLGLLNMDGTGAKPLLPTLPLGATGGPLAVNHLIDLASLPETSDAMVGGPAWLTNMNVVGAAMKLTTSGSGDYILLNSLPNTLLGYPVIRSSAVPRNRTKSTGSNLSVAIFGSWASMLVGLWSGVDILADPYTRGASGAIRLYAFQDCDIGVRHIESFAAFTDITTA